MTDPQLLARLDVLIGLVAAGVLFLGFGLILLNPVLGVLAVGTVVVGALLAARSYRRTDSRPTESTGEATTEPRV
jgi:hypothetical protein